MQMTNSTINSPAYGREEPFWEAALLRRFTPVAPDVGLGDYVHHYEQPGYPGQLLSTQFRELIATLMLGVVGHQRFAARHIRRLYRLGVTGQVVIDTFWAASPFVGRAHVLTGVRCVHLADDPTNLEGSLPPDGAPRSLTDFAELHFGATPPERSSLASTPEWQLIAKVDPRLAEVTSEFYAEIMGASQSGRTWTLPPAARELIAVVCLAWRGQVELAAEHVRTALESGVEVQHIVEALSSAVPMTGLVTLQLGVRAVLLAQSEVGGQASQ
jgi:alkylhydroperoxidase/carboxymuconolactone decarboxylase family protein YurZ